MKTHHQKIAIVIGIGSYNDIGLIRSCGEAGIKSIYINTARFDIIPIWRSRYVVDFLYLDTDSEIINFITQTALANSQKEYVLFGASDSAALLLDKKHKIFPRNVICPHANGLLDNLMNKETMSHMATKAGLKVPKTRLVSLSEFPKLPEFPVILKPNESINGKKTDIRVCFTETEYISSLEYLRLNGYQEILEQQYIHSSSSKEIGITGISYPDGSVQFYGYINKIRNRNNINNFGCYHPNIKLEINNSLSKYIKSTGYVGIFDTDFIQNGSDIFFIECNFRNGAYGYCTTYAGFNMPKLFIFNGNQKKYLKLRDTVFMEERTDVLNVIDKTMSLRDWFVDVCHVNTFLWWNWKDPMPLIRIPHFIKNIFR